MSAQYFVGWDVGAWNCDKNKKSRDAIVILDSQGLPVGTPRRGNLRDGILSESNVSARDWIGSLFDWCLHPRPAGDASVVVAIDAPLGFPLAIRELLDGRISPGLKKGFVWNTNPYLYRETELRLFPRFSPLSPIKDMIGSQATKAMHAVTRFFGKPVSAGIWRDGTGVTAIETYPAICRDEKNIAGLTATRLTRSNPDVRDAHVCAAVAYLFHFQRSLMPEPGEDVDPREGWIWFPDAERPGQNADRRAGISI